MSTTERFRPPSHVAPDGLKSKALFFLRRVLDFQFNTIFSTLQRAMPQYSGTVIDIGCGNCPFEHLVDTNKARYIGIDVADAQKWDYTNSKIVTYDGKNIPFAAASVDHLICTEVLEHVPEPHDLIADMYRVLKPGGTGIITIPWSARFHYKPYDYHRYTPSTLEALFNQFASVRVQNRGTDINAIVNKSIVLYFGNVSTLTESVLWLPVKVLLLLVFAPVIGLLVLWGHLALAFGWGSSDDPLGYTIWLQK
ncbi:class I SAM-dependent methyltransferase [Spirosoma rhododendri]|uniref:Class I SAM-dependent methyltransferase n=1 Tax=Spirosoma rhododendri TaxID=2728024 RepID=A0A7L5DS80_9BACT|nr:class I SAM-dependent methyltransferase [Spirosoma rhododendri]QJD80995.1 class I SAM-dependent methyltransferase [Spirosoma rhododendri]